MNEFTVCGSRFAVLRWFTPDANIPKLELSTWTIRFVKPTGNRERGTHSESARWHRSLSRADRIEFYSGELGSFCYGGCDSRSGLRA